MRAAVVLTFACLLMTRARAEDGGVRCPVPASATFEFRLERVTVQKAVVPVADITCKTFVVEESASGVLLTVTSPRGLQYTAAEVYAMFVAALRQRGLEAVGDAPVIIRKQQ